MVLEKNSKLLNFLFILAIIAIAAFFRLWQLDRIPPGLYPDVAINGNDALDTLKTGNFKVFYPENNGREGLFFWLIALSFSIFAVSVWSIKIVAATIGILTVLGLYLLTRELFSRNVALLSSFFLAISFWHTNFSRIGFRAILVPFILVFAFYYLFRGFRTKRILNFIISGIFLGLGFYTYISFRFIVLLLPLLLLCWYFTCKKEGEIKKFLKFTLYCLLSIVIIGLPIAFYFIQNPQDFLGRAGDVSVFGTKAPLKEFVKSLALHLGMFNFWGDQNWRHNFAGEPMLFFPIGFLFLAGIIFSVKDFLSSWRQKERFRFQTSCFVLSWFFIFLLPGILSFEGVPHALRIIGVIPPVYILSGLGGYRLYAFFAQKIKNRGFLIFLCFLFLAFLLYGEFNKYFFLWAKNPNVEGAFTKRFADIGYYLNSLPSDTEKYVIVNESGVPVPFPNGIPMPAQTAIFIERTKYGEPRALYLLPENLSRIKIEKKAVIVPMRNDAKLFEEIQKRFPSGKIKIENNFSVYEIR